METARRVGPHSRPVSKPITLPNQARRETTVQTMRATRTADDNNDKRQKTYGLSLAREYTMEIESYGEPGSVLSACRSGAPPFDSRGGLFPCGVLRKAPDFMNVSRLRPRCGITDDRR